MRHIGRANHSADRRRVLHATPDSSHILDIELNESLVRLEIIPPTDQLLVHPASRCGCPSLQACEYPWLELEQLRRCCRPNGPEGRCVFWNDAGLVAGLRKNPVNAL